MVPAALNRPQSMHQLTWYKVRCGCLFFNQFIYCAVPELSS